MLTKLATKSNLLLYFYEKFIKKTVSAFYLNNICIEQKMKNLEILCDLLIQVHLTSL